MVDWARMFRSDDELRVLHGLHLRGFSTPAALARSVDLPVDLVTTHLDAGCAVGWVRRRRGPGDESEVGAYTLTAAGRLRNRELLAAELTSSGAGPEIEIAYRGFLTLNPGLLEVCTRWQVKDLERGELNDHVDPAYDAVVVADLARIDGRIQPICAELGRCLARFARYGPRLSLALDRVRRGDPDWLDRPLVDSYHTVWFELHEDLLSTLGRDRATERSAGGPLSVP